MYKIDSKTNDQIELIFSSNGKDWEEQVNKVYEQQKTKFNVMGFRKGHAPRKVIEQIYGEGFFFDDAFQNVIHENLDKFIEENPTLEPVTEPEFVVENFSKEGVSVRVKFKFIPDFKVAKHEGLEIKVHKYNTTDSEVDAEINQNLEEHAKFTDVDRPIETSDRAIIDFVGYVDGVAFQDGSAKDYPLDIGSHSFIGNFEEQLVGAKKNDVVKVVVDFPSAYFNQELAGKNATFDVTVKQVKEKHLPTLDDKFVADTTEFETVEEYRKATKEHIDFMKENSQNSEYELELLGTIVKNTKIDMPSEYIKYVEDNVEKQIDKVAAVYGMDLKTFANYNGFDSVDKFVEKTKVDAIENIKKKRIIRKLAEEYNVQVPENLFHKQQDKEEAEDRYLREQIGKILREKNKKIPTFED